MKKLTLLITLLLLVQLSHSQDWKVYKSGNYTYIENLIDGQLIEGGSSTIEFRKLLESDTDYSIFKDGIDQLHFTIDVTDMQDVNGVTFTLSTFEKFKEANSGASQDVNIQDQTTEIIDLFLHRTLNTFTVSVNTVVDVNTFEADPGHSIIAGNTLCFLEDRNFSQFTVLEVSTNTITVDSPFDRVYTTSGTYEHHTPDMTVDGSITPQIYFIKPAPGVKYDIVRIVIVIDDESNMDFSTFGSIDGGITNGCVLRKKDGIYKNLFNWKTNGEFIARSFDFAFQTNIGNNERSFTSRTTYGGQSKRGVVIRLDGDLGDELQVIIQDNLTSQSRMIMIAQGHVVED